MIPNKYSFSKNIRKNEALRASFNQLVEKTYFFSFEPWYQSGYWGDNYIPYVLTENNKVIANASANIMHFTLQGEEKHYLQIGTVMTHPEHRNQGLSRFLVEQILADYQACDTIFLFANDSVLDFYPKFGFAPAIEHYYSWKVTTAQTGLVPLNTRDKKDTELIVKKVREGQVFSDFSQTNDLGLVMFYATGPLSDCFYYLSLLDIVIVAERDAPMGVCFGIFGNTSASLPKILSYLALEQTKEIVLGFTPKDVSVFTKSIFKEEDSTLFVLAEKENPFINEDRMIPLLSHA